MPPLRAQGAESEPQGLQNDSKNEAKGNLGGSQKMYFSSSRPKSANLTKHNYLLCFVKVCPQVKPSISIHGCFKNDEKSMNFKILDKSTKQDPFFHLFGVQGAILFAKLTPNEHPASLQKFLIFTWEHHFEHVLLHLAPLE